MVLLHFFCISAALPVCGEGADASLRILTYNVRFQNEADGPDVWANRRDSVTAVIAAADVVGLQEVLSAQFEDIRERTPDMAWYGVGRDDGKQLGEHTPVGFRKERFTLLDQGTFWLSPRPAQAGSKGWDAALPRIATWARLADRKTGRRLLVAATHFDHVGEKARLESARLLRTQLQGLVDQAERVVIMGDLNALPDSRPLQTLLDASARGLTFVDSRALSQNEPEGPLGTFNGFQEIRPEMRIDYVLLAGPWHVLSYQTLDPRTPAGRFASDHQPVTIAAR